MRRYAVPAITLLALVLPLGPLRAQPVVTDDLAGTFVTGRVVDASGAPIAGARITLTPGDAGSREAVTDGVGRFRIAVPPGTYGITAAAPGFVEQTASVSTAGPAHEFVLVIAGLHETVDVSGRGGYRVPATSTATRTPTPLRDIPQSVSIVSRTLIDDLRLSSMADVIRFMPGVGIAQGEGNRDTPIFRGNSSTADFFVDGIRDDVQYLRDVYNIDRVEALKGPNAMIFGRGGAGGVINRVTRQADWGTSPEVALQVGSWDNRRMTADLGAGFNEVMAGRVSAVYEHSDSYRDGVGLERAGINPTVALRLGSRTLLRAGYEFFTYERTADRGIPSFEGRPIVTDARTFFGDPRLSTTDATINHLSSSLDHDLRPGLTLRNRFSFGGYDKSYQNVFPGATDATGTHVSISAYNNATRRQNLFNQTDLIVTARTGRIGHTVLAGLELGRQETDNFRNTGYFTSLGPSVTSVSVPVSNPTLALPVTFRQSATDTDNHGVATTVAIYAQDQIQLSARVSALLGLRVDRFRMDFRDNRTGGALSSDDTLVSPRLGLVYKPVAPVSVYGSYSLTRLPRAGEQLNSLSLTNRTLDPETFRNYEAGAKWEANPVLSFTAALYRLDRSNVAVPDPDDATRSLLVDAQRTTGLELEMTGSLSTVWSVTGGYAYQDGEITRSLSASAQAGAELAQVPTHSLSIWSRYDLTQRWSAALGLVHRTDMFTSTDNRVVLPGFTRIDAGVFFRLSRHFRTQINVENLFDDDYHANAHNNNNITPGSPRAVRVSLITTF